MKEIDFARTLKLYFDEIHGAAASILSNLKYLNSMNTSELFWFDDSEPMLIEDDGYVYLRSRAIEIPFSDNEERDYILKELEDWNKGNKKSGYILDFDSENVGMEDDGYVWCAVMWPIENWFQV